jgi:hypothetical protein
MHLLAALVAFAGCLSSPEPATSDAAVGIDGDGGGPTLDAPVAMNECGAPGQYTAQDWPPSTPMGIRDVVADDVNGDGEVDLVITNGNVGDTDYLGFWVLLGPQTDPANLVFHAFGASAAYPRSIAMHDVLGNGCLDITTFGENTADTTGFIEVFENTGPPMMFAATPVLKDAGFRPVGDGFPVHVVYAALDTDSAVDDVIVGDLGEMHVLYTSGVDFANELATATPVQLGDDGTDQTNWNNVNAIYPRQSVGNSAVDDLLVVEVNDIHWLHNDESRGFAATTPDTINNAFAFSAFGVVEAQFDMMGPVDIIGGGGQRFGAYTIDDTMGIDFEVFGWQSSVPADDNNIDDIVAGNLGGLGQPEVVMLDRDETNGSHVFLIDGVFASGATVLPNSFFDFDMANEGIHPVAIVIADFNGDQSPELWGFDDVGNAVCLERSPDVPELRLCQ